MFKPQYSWFVAITLSFAAFTLPQLALAQTEAGTKEENTAEKTALSSHIELIAQSKRLEDASSRLDTPLKQALKTTLSRAGQDLDQLTWVSQNGSIAGRVYATAIIDRLNKTPKALLFESLLADQANTNVAYLSAGSTCHYSVSDIAIDQRSAHPILKILP